MPIDDAFIDMVQRTYYSTALSFVKSYSDDAESNGLIYDRHQESRRFPISGTSSVPRGSRQEDRKAAPRSLRGTE